MAERKRLHLSQFSRTRKMVIAIVFFAVLLLVSGGMLLSRFSDWGWRGGENKYIHKIINSGSPVSYEWSPEFEIVGDGQLICADCSVQLRTMLADCRAAGLEPVLYSCYRSYSAQQAVIERLAQRYVEKGMDTEAALHKAVEMAGAPGCSEHQLGYAVDIIDRSQQEPDIDCGQSDVLDWLRENSWRYGFIIRYTESGREITGSEYMPWHFRFVGEGAAEQIHNLGITLEEYNKLFFS